jgi:hypothetical protein
MGETALIIECFVVSRDTIIILRRSNLGLRLRGFMTKFADCVLYVQAENVADEIVRCLSFY